MAEANTCAADLHAKSAAELARGENARRSAPCGLLTARIEIAEGRGTSARAARSVLLPIDMKFAGIFRLLLWVCLVKLAGCDGRHGGERPYIFHGKDAERPRVKPSSAAPLAAPPSPIEDPERAGPIRVERLEGEEPAVFVVRGRGIGPGKLVFLHGMCGHGLGYAQSFQRAAAEKGQLIAPQADVVCGDGPFAKWTLDIATIDGQIVGAFRRLHGEEPEDICVIGMSQGATRAADLARHYPDRYTRLISMGAPTVVKAAGLEKLRAAVLMVGQRERKDLMLESERALKRAGVPVRTMIIPEADHAGMGPTPEATMDEALDWIWENARAAPVRAGE